MEEVENSDTSSLDLLTSSGSLSVWSGNSSLIISKPPTPKVHRKARKRILKENPRNIVSTSAATRKSGKEPTRSPAEAQKQSTTLEPDDETTCQRDDNHSDSSTTSNSKKGHIPVADRKSFVPVKGSTMTSSGSLSVWSGNSSPITSKLPTPKVDREARKRILKENPRIIVSPSAATRKSGKEPSRSPARERPSTSRTNPLLPGQSTTNQGGSSPASNRKKSLGKSFVPEKGSGRELYRPPVSSRERPSTSTTRSPLPGQRTVNQENSSTTRKHGKSPILVADRKSFVPKKRSRLSACEQHIYSLQRSTGFLISKMPFQRLVKEVSVNIGARPDFRYTALALQALQESAEAFLIGLFEDSYLLTLHAKRVTLMAKDMALARRIRGDR